ncbi:hypothetical protein J6590_064813 [Homalodisca vitripennis]|nr:hypothetical protein J6590_064813 [Homalodisca vitripennis]
MIRSISEEMAAVGCREWPPEPEEDPPLLETAAGDADTPPSPPPLPPTPTAPKHILNGSTEDLYGYWRIGMMCQAMKQHSLRAGNKGYTRTGEILDIVIMVEIERVWRERNKENRQINVAN